jgi:GrpB-like predicted nucleotidyltransferase (UPF0157 family)
MGAAAGPGHGQAASAGREPVWQTVAMSRPPRSSADNPMTEEQIRAAWVVERPRLDGPITLAEYDPAWPGLFEREATRIRAALGDRVVMLEHTGSTSVPGLAAKPIIGMILVVADPADEPAYEPDLQAAGYTLAIREPDWNQHRMFKGPDTDVNLHVHGPASPEIGHQLALRDWLRSHDDDRELYERTKRELAARRWDYVQNYADAKGAVIEPMIERALAARRGRRRSIRR